jgi:ribosomal protein L7/L12
MAADYPALLQEKLDQGVDLDTALTSLRSQGASILDSIKAVREVQAVSLGDAKQLVAGSPAWDDLREDHNRFIDETLAVFKAEDEAFNAEQD